MSIARRLSEYKRQFAVLGRREKDTLVLRLVEIIVFPVVAALLIRYVDHTSVSLAFYLGLLFVLFFVFQLLIVLTRPLRMDDKKGLKNAVDDMIKYAHVDLSDGAYAFKETLRIPECLASLLQKDGGCWLPVTGSIDVVMALLEARTSGKDKLRMRTIHNVPVQHVDSLWWGTKRAGEYFRVQTELIAAKRLSVDRLVMVHANGQVSLEDINGWIGQRSAGITVRWCKWHATDSLDGFSDFVLLEAVTDGGTAIETHLILEEDEPDGSGRERVRIYRRGSDSASSNTGQIIDRARAYFDSHWGDVFSEILPRELLDDHIEALFKEIQGKNFKKFSQGVMAFYQALQKIKAAKKFIYAVDVSDLKERIEAIYENPTYLAWFETTLNWARNAGPKHGKFVRVFVLRMNAESLREFKQRHLPKYYDKGHILPACELYVVFEEKVKEWVMDSEAGIIAEFVGTVPRICAYLQNLDEMSPDPRVVALRILQRDFLVADGMLYDYRSDTVAFDLENLPNFLVEPKDGDGAFLDEWRRVVDKLSNLGTSEIKEKVLRQWLDWQIDRLEAEKTTTNKEEVAKTLLL